MKKLLIIFLCLGAILGINYTSAYISNNRDTLRAPEKMFDISFDTTDYNLLVEYSDLAYYYKPSTDVIMIVDKTNGYAWKSGIDYSYKSQTEEVCNSALIDSSLSYEEKLEICSTPDVYSLSTTNLEIANSIVTVEYYTKSSSSILDKKVSSGSLDVSDSDRTFAADGLDSTHFKYSINFEEAFIEIAIDFYLTNTGITYEIRDEEITGEGSNYIQNILVMPYLGAQGGAIQNYTLESYEYDGETFYDREKVDDDTNGVEELKMTDGYSFIPDGSGALVRFQQNSQQFDPIVLPVYGVNKSLSSSYISEEETYNTDYYASLPLYGMAVGDEQNAFVSFTTSGDEYMTIYAYPDESENGIKYNRTYNRYNYNNQYYQVYNQAGDSSPQLQSDRFHYDVVTVIEFLSGEDADYLGMADAYRDYLLDNDLLFDNKSESSDIPLHLDFLMSDSEESIIGYQNVNMTTTEDVDNILTTLKGFGIDNINASLMGFQDGGVTLSSKTTIKYNNATSSKSDIKSLVSDYATEGIDISLTLDYYTINEESISYNSNAVKHYSGVYDLYFQSTNQLIKDIGYLRPDKAYKYATSNINTLVKATGIDSVTLSGITSNKISHYENEVADDLQYYSDILEYADEYASVNAVSPNSYLWKYVTRYLNLNPFNSQFLCETDTVPFISYLLNPVMEVYADYCNFSFYDDESVLRMIDYNISPTFLLTQESSHLLSSTNLSNYYTTEYALYEDRIVSIYNTINDDLSNVYNSNWINREVVSDGVVVNTYDNGIQIIINYTEAAYTYNGTKVGSMSSEVIYLG